MNNHQVLPNAPRVLNVRDYDIFEEFPDGTTTWRACVFGIQNVALKLRELAESSDHRFFALNLYDRDRVAIRPPAVAKKSAEEPNHTA